MVLQTPPGLVAPTFDGQTAIVNTFSTASDPFGIHLGGGSGPGIVDATAKWDDFPLLSPDYIMSDGATGLAALPFTPADEAGVSMTMVMDALFQQMPLWTPAVSAPVGEDAPRIDLPMKGNAAPPVKDKSAGWPSLAAGVLLSTGMTAAAVEERTRRRLPYSATTE